MSDRSFALFRRFTFALVVLLPAVAAFTFLAFEASSQPRFCGSCHVMTPYYESWKHSTHRDVACVECHIPPGVESTLRKKYEAVSMVASYFTGTYSTNPWTEIDDKSCLRSGCHTKRVLLGRELYRETLFDHQPHLAEMRRGKQLRCTSCHSQIVQGSHISVTPSSCFLCHFKDRKLNQGTARCTLCHAVPARVIETAGLSFDHSDVQRFGMDCMSCHEGVVKGDGAVPSERCYTCHNDVERLERYEETEFLHQTHVTDHKVECLHCHMEITHQVPAREEAVATPCEACHPPVAGHSAVRDLYRGIGAKDIEPRPAAMFLAGIRCEACHTSQAEGVRAADSVSCMSCHGPSYLTIYNSWKAGLDDRMSTVEGELAAVEALGAADAAKNGADGVEGDNRLALTRANVDLLLSGHAIHNPPYALAILDRAHRDLNELWTEAGQEGAPAPTWLAAPYQIECLGCHFGIEHLWGTAFEMPFPHQTHTVSAGLRCTVCHGDMNDHGALRLREEDCASCHERITEPMANLSAEECLKCHVAAIGPVSDQVRFPHEKHVAAGLDCSMCHDGVGDVPHLEFARSAEAVPKLGHEFCSTCHGDDVLADDGSMPEGANCDLCHVGD